MMNSNGCQHPVVVGENVGWDKETGMVAGDTRREVGIVVGESHQVKIEKDRRQLVQSPIRCWGENPCGTQLGKQMNCQCGAGMAWGLSHGIEWGTKRTLSTRPQKHIKSPKLLH